MLSDCKWGFPVSRIVLTPDCIASVEKKDVASQSRYVHGRDANMNTLASLVDDVSPDDDCSCFEYLLASVGHVGRRLL